MKRIFLLALIAILHGTTVSAQQPYRVYFGNIHAHTSYSDGSKDGDKSGVKTPADAYAFAKQSKNFDFLGISEHNHSGEGMNRANYSKGLQQAENANQDDRFVALFGMEYGMYEQGHILVYGSNKLIGWEADNADIITVKNNYATMYQQIANSPSTFATLAHPAANHFNGLRDQPYNLLADQAICGVAVANGTHGSKTIDYSDKRKLDDLGYYMTMLSRGYIIGPTIDHDNHYTTFGRHSASRTAVLAKRLTRDDVIEAYRNNRFYATQDWNAKISFTINGEPMGSYLKGTSQLDIQATINDDPSDQVKTIELFYGVPGSGKKATVLTRSSSSSLGYQFNAPTSTASYYFLKITQKDGDQIVTSPIWAKN